jgi:hypothetical protein
MAPHPDSPWQTAAVREAPTPRAGAGTGSGRGEVHPPPVFSTPRYAVVLYSRARGCGCGGVGVFFAPWCASQTLPANPHSHYPRVGSLRLFDPFLMPRRTRAQSGRAFSCSCSCFIKIGDFFFLFLVSFLTSALRLRLVRLSGAAAFPGSGSALGSNGFKGNGPQGGSSSSSSRGAATSARARPPPSAPPAEKVRDTGLGSGEGSGREPW